jgi:predicted flap endonuclease-1-like 5' DNA nuclease
VIWLQENWWIAAIVALIAVVIVAALLRRPKPDLLDLEDELASAAREKAAPKPKPLEPIKPEIIAAEPARFKPIEPVAPVVPAPKPAPAPAPVSAPAPEPTAQPSTPSAPSPAPAAEAPPVSVPTEPAPQPIASAPAPAVPAASASSAGDNLRLMKGVGPKLVTLLNGMGITSFAQIAAWTDADIARIDPQLGAFQGRITRDNWVDQAGYLAKADKSGFEAKYGALGGEL